MKILIIDNNRMASSFGSLNLVGWCLKTAPLGSEILVRRAPDQDLPPVDEPFDALVISGSMTSCLEETEAWIKPYDSFVSKHIEVGTPILGICYGHQTLARCLFRMKGEVPKMRVSPQAEFGWQTIKITEKTAIFEGLKDQFNTYESHFEEVFGLPPGTKKFAESDHCEIQGFEVVGKPVFGIQFHPEYSIQQGEESIANKIKKGVPSEWILNPGKGSQLYDENVGKVIFGNFFRIANSRK
jgi:GMP synthase-like glutamine amidotransferase